MTISGSFNVSSNSSIDAMNQKVLDEVNAQLATQGNAAISDSSLIVMEAVTGDDGNVTVNYRYNLTQPSELERGSNQRALDMMNQLAEPNSLTDIFQIMSLFHEISRSQRDSAREIRQASAQVQVQSLKDQAADMLKAAGAALAAGIVSGVMSITAGLISIGGAMKASGTLKTNGAEAANIQMQKYQGWSSIATGLGQTGSAVGEYFSGMYQSEGKKDEAKSAEYAALREEFNEYAQNTQQVISEVRQMMQQLIQAELETNRSILRV